jgi:phospholipase C
MHTTKHVVVIIMQGNRSFDGHFRNLSVADGIPAERERAYRPPLGSRDPFLHTALIREFR